jgi:isoleucyl-tRNA synthetase
VVVNGLVLAEDGAKMSKSKKNYPDLMLVINRYGSDALRYLLMSSPAVHAEDFQFSEKAVDDVVKKHIGRLNNIVSFYEMYELGNSLELKSTNQLDIWIKARLMQLNKEISDNLDCYKIDKASRPIADFIDDLSTWYIRRSRDRFKSENEMDKIAALSTTRSVLIDFSKLIAPFMPFIAEDIYKRLKGSLESVHLESWPKYTKFDQKIIDSMSEVRKICSFALEARTKAKIIVRQPLSKLSVKGKFSEQLIELIKDEVNVKEVINDDSIVEGVYLDTEISPELKEEGTVREMIRAIQDLRKSRKFTIQDRLTLIVDTDRSLAELINKNKEYITNTTLLKDIRFSTLEGEAMSFGEYLLKLDIEK